MSCYVCNRLISDKNKTEEHILLNSIGGRLKSNSLICRECNSKFGESIDTDLSNQLNFIANMLNISRQRGKPQRVSGKSAKGDEILLEPGGKPTMKQPIIELNEQENKLTVTAPRMKGLKKQLKGLPRKYPNINLDEELSKAEVKNEYLSDSYSFDQEFGGESAFRSLCKTAVNFYMFHGGSRENITHLIEYIKSGSDTGRRVVKFYYPKQQQKIISKSDNEVYHSIVLKGNTDNRLLYCYIELFNVFKVLVILNDDYHGHDIEEKYIFDVISTKTRHIEQVNITDDREELCCAVESSDLLQENLEQELKELLKVIYNKQHSESIEQLLQRAIKNSFKNYPEATMITHEMIDEIVESVMKEITPLILHQESLNSQER